MNEPSPARSAIIECYINAGLKKPTEDDLFYDFSYYNFLYTSKMALHYQRASTTVKKHAQHIKNFRKFFQHIQQLREECSPTPLPLITLKRAVLRSDNLDELFYSGLLRNLSVSFDGETIQASNFSSLHYLFIYHILKRKPLLMQIALLNEAKYGVFNFPQKDRKTFCYAGGRIDVNIDPGPAIRSMMNWSELMDYSDFSINILPFDYDFMQLPENKYILETWNIKPQWL